MQTRIYIGILALITLYSCTSDNTVDCCENEVNPQLIINFRFDPNQVRLNNFGQPSSIPEDNAAQTPTFKQMSANYIEFAPTATTFLGQGLIIYKGEETTEGGDLAIDFRESILTADEETFFTIPVSALEPGNYDWVRVSLAYQEGDIDILVSDTEVEGTLASFLGYNTYIPSFDINGSTFEINENKRQGFWAFEALGFTAQGLAPEGATTVPNPIFDTSPVPQGSCVLTGEFENGLTITGEETEDIVITLSFSINKSFEWKEVNFDGKYEPEIGEQVVDMGLRGLIPIVSN